MRTKILGLLAATALSLPVAVNAAPRTQSGTTSTGSQWIAKSTIVGQTSTGTIASGGNPIYLGNTPAYSGVVALIINFSSGSFICSGTLMNDRRSIVTAAHCVTDANLGLPTSTTVYFGGGQVAGDFFNAPGTTAITASDVFVNSAYTGEVVDQNDIAVIRLSQLAPTSAAGFDLATENELTGLDFNVAGYGARSDTGGAIGANLGTGRLRQGLNRYDFRLGDADFGNYWRDISTAEIAFSYLSDFDNGRAANDASCFAAADAGIAASAKYCNLGLGAREVGVAGGDSGGPQFINGKLASVTSYGLTFGSPQFGDIDTSLNSSWGEFSGYVPTFLHRDFINRLLVPGAVPEPATWLQMIFGFGLIGATLRRRQSAKIAVA